MNSNHNWWRNYMGVTAQVGTEILQNNGGRVEVVWKELCDGKAEMFEDAGKAARGWRYNFV
jgi:hypothetical protein